MADRSKDWLAQAERDLRHARNAAAAADYEWACFAAQQAAEKAVKAVHLRLGMEGWGHSVKKLLEALPTAIRPADDLVDAALRLDRFYIPTRYPNGFPEGVPGEYFTAEDARSAIEDAARVLAFARQRLAV